MRCGTASEKQYEFPRPRENTGAKRPAMTATAVRAEEATAPTRPHAGACEEPRPQGCGSSSSAPDSPVTVRPGGNGPADLLTLVLPSSMLSCV